MTEDVLSQNVFSLPSTYLDICPIKYMICFCPHKSIIVTHPRAIVLMKYREIVIYVSDVH